MISDYVCPMCLATVPHQERAGHMTQHVEGKIKEGSEFSISKPKSKE